MYSGNIYINWVFGGGYLNRDNQIRIEIKLVSHLNKLYQPQDIRYQGYSHCGVIQKKKLPGINQSSGRGHKIPLQQR